MSSLEKKIAQLICVEVRYPELEKDPDKIDQLKKDLKKYQWGSIIIFDADAIKCSKLIKELQSISDIPLFVCSDLERGSGQHFKGATNLPSNMAISATNNLDNAFKAGKLTAQEAIAIGVNVVFAPSVDVNCNYKNPIINIRSYGENPKQVTDMAQAFVYGCSLEGVMPTIKHFPGHGDTSVDSHVELPVIKKSRKKLDKTELYPFIKLIENDVPAIMSAHIAVPSLDDSLKPATLSKKIITDLLRKEFDYQGLIFTDALIMEGIKNDFEESQEVQALLAGCDILLMPPKPIEAFEKILKAVKKGVISQDIIENSYNRIIKYKEKFCNNKITSDIKWLNSSKNKKTVQNIIRESITKVKQETKLPLKNKKIINVIIDQDDKPEVWETLAESLKNHKIETLVINTKTQKSDLLEINNKIANFDTVILSYFSKIMGWKKNIYPDNTIMKWLKNDLLNKKEVITIAFFNPYLIKKLPEIKNYYCTFSDHEESQRAIVEVLFSDLKPQGISPVNL